MNQNDTERDWPREHRCSGCGTWGFEMSVWSNDTPRCGECGEKIADLDGLDSRPTRLADRIEEVILNVKSIEEYGGDEDAHNTNSGYGYCRKTVPVEDRATDGFTADDYTLD